MKTMLVVVAIVIAAFAGFTLFTLHWVYSSGDRSGWVQKLSRKGWVCKTWEGELTMVTQPGVPPQIFTFTVRDDSIADRILKVAGQRVSLSYEQHPGLPSKCFGETEYFITQVQPAPGP